MYYIAEREEFVYFGVLYCVTVKILIVKLRFAPDYLYDIIN